MNVEEEYGKFVQFLISFMATIINCFLATGAVSMRTVIRITLQLKKIFQNGTLLDALYTYNKTKNGVIRFFYVL